MERRIRWTTLGLAALPLALAVATPKAQPPPRCDADLSVAADPDDWSTLGGRFDHGVDDGEPFVGMSFRATSDTLRFDRDASLRVPVRFACREGETPAALIFEVRFDRTLRAAAELNDVMLLGPTSRMLDGAGVAAPGAWTQVRIAVPADAPPFDALHFGVGVAWAREHPGAEVHMALRRVRLERRRRLHEAPAPPVNAGRRDPADPERADPRPFVVVAPGAPAFTVVDFATQRGGALGLTLPPHVRAEVWRADWLDVEQKPGVYRREAIRLLPYARGVLPAQPDAVRRFWIRLSAAAPVAERGVVVANFAGAAVTVPVETVALSVPGSPFRAVMYDQMNENWAGYARYEAFYRDAPAHFAQLRSLGFTGVHLAEEPRFSRDKHGGWTADFSVPGRYWQRWPLPLDRLLKAASEAGLDAPILWEGLRVFRRDDVWSALAGDPCAPSPAADAANRTVALASAALPAWRARAAAPYLSIDDEPGVHGDADVTAAAAVLQALKQAGYQTYLTTHARQFDSFHRLAPWLDVNALHAEDVTAGAAAFVAAHHGELWLYNGGSFNLGPPAGDRFFAGLYAWVAGARGVAQWIYTRPSNLADPLDLRTRLADDAQFYALPGEGEVPAATPALLGFADGIVDRHVLALAARRASVDPEVRRLVEALRARYALPRVRDELTPARLRARADFGFRAALLRAMAGGGR